MYHQQLLKPDDISVLVFNSIWCLEAGKRPSSSLIGYVQHKSKTAVNPSAFTSSNMDMQGQGLCGVYSTPWGSQNQGGRGRRGFNHQRISCPACNLKPASFTAPDDTNLCQTDAQTKPEVTQQKLSSF